MDDVSEMDMLHPEDFNGSDNEDTRSELKFDPGVFDVLYSLLQSISM